MKVNLQFWGLKREFSKANSDSSFNLIQVGIAGIAHNNIRIQIQFLGIFNYIGIFDSKSINSAHNIQIN